MGTSASSRVVRFGPFEADAQTGELRKQGRKIRLQGQPFQILLMLLEHPGELVTREQLHQKLWPADTFVDFDHGLNNAVNRLREALNDSAERPRFIETLAKKGYRFIAPVNGSANTKGDISASSKELGQESEIKSTESASVSVAAPAISVSIPAMNKVSVASQFSEKFIEKAEKAMEDRRQPSWYRRVGLTFVGGSTLLLVGLIAYKTISKPMRPNGSPKVTRVTNTGNVNHAAISPDGKYVAYLQDEMGHRGSSLWLQQISTSVRARLLAADSEKSEEYDGLKFSPDGGYLYYTRNKPNSPTRNLYRISVLGGTPEEVLANVYSDFALSPDGESVAHIAPDPMDGREALVVVSIHGPDEKVIARLPQGDDEFSDPAWSRDGKLLAVVEHVNGKKLNHLLIVPLHGGAERRITPDEFSLISNPAWLTDGSGLIATAFGRWVSSNGQLENQAKHDQLWEFPREGKPRRILNDFLRYHGRVSVSADSTTVATVASDLVSAVWVGPASDPDRVVPVTPQSGHYVANRGVSWTGTGKIVYWTNASDTFDLVVMDANGGNPRTLPREPHYVMHPEACSDGHTLVYTGAYPFKRHVVRRDLDGARSQELATGAFPQCSPDSKWVVYYDDVVSGIPLKISLEGGEPIPLMEEECWRAGISPNGNWIACVDGSEKLTIVPFSGGKPIRQFDLPPKFDRSTIPMRWTPDSQNVVFAVDEGGFENLWAQPMRGGPLRALTHFTSQQIDYFAFSHDGKKIAIGRGTPSSDVVLVSNLR